MDLYTLIGLGGVGFYVCSYALVQVQRMDGNGAAFSAMNVIAASMVLVSLMEDFNLPSMVTQVTWIVVGLVGLLLRARRQLLNTSQDARVEARVDARVEARVDARVDARVEMEAAAAEQQFSLAPVVRANARAARPPVNPPTEIARPESGSGAASTGRRLLLVDRSTLNLRPDKAPDRRSRVTLGLPPDLAPAQQ